MKPEERAAVIRRVLLRVAENVAKHTVQRSGWSADDECFNVDLRESERELQDAIREALAEEREACARIAEGDLDATDRVVQTEIAARIRARCK